MSNNIAASLQRAVVLDHMMRGFQRRIVPILAFAFVARDVVLQGTNKILVPYYPLDTQPSKKFAGVYVFDQNTNTMSKEVTVNQRVYKDLAITSEEFRRQPNLSPEMLLELKGEKLAEDVITDIMSVVTSRNFPEVWRGAPSSYDSDDIADFVGVADALHWPTMGRSNVVREQYKVNLLKDGIVKDTSKFGSDAPIRRADIPNIFGFDFFSSPTIPGNNGVAVAVTAVAATNVLNSVAPHGLQAGDRVVFPTLTGGAGLTAGGGTPTPYYVIAAGLTATAFKVSATLGGAEVDITSDATAGTVMRYENLMGFIAYQSAILVAFSPIEPHPNVRRMMTAYEQMTDPLTGITLEYRAWGDPDTDTSKEVLECNYGFDLGEADALRRITSA